MKAKFFIFTILVLGGCGGKEVIKQGSAAIIPQFTKGNISRYSITSITENTMELQGSSQTQTSRAIITIENRIDSIRGEKIFQKFTVSKVEGTVATPMGIQTIPNLDQMEGKTIKIVTTKRGKVLKATKENVEDDFGLNLRNVVESFYDFLPEGIVNVGDQWEKKKNENGIKADNMYKLEGFKNKNNKRIAIITGNGTIEINKKIDQRGANIEMSLSGNTKSRIFWFVDSGRISLHSSHYGMEGKGKVSGAMGNIDVTFYIDQDITIKPIQ